MDKPLTKSQHYIPQLLLRNFANDSEQVFECLHRENNIYQTSITNSMTSNYTYEHIDFEPNEIEKFFSGIESDIGPYIEKLIESIDDLEKSIVKIEDVKRIAFAGLKYYLLLYYRSGALLNEMGFDLKKDKNSITSMMQKIMDPVYLGGLYDTIINNYDFALIKSSNKSFLLADQCVATIALSLKNKFIDGSNRHMGLKDTLILMPISSEYYIVFINGKELNFIFKDKLNILSDNEVNSINKIIINNSYVKTISLKKGPLLLALNDYEFQLPHAVMTNRFRINKKKELFYFNDDAKAWDMINNISNSWKFRGIGRNESCPCGSGHKYKNCCSNAYNMASRIIAKFAATQSFPFTTYKDAKYAVLDNATIEKPISEFFPEPIEEPPKLNN